MSLRKNRVLFKNSAFKLTPTSLKQADLTAELVSPTCLQITTEGETRTISIPAAVPGGCVGYRGEIPLLTAMYNLALQELYSDISPEGLMVAGASWSTVWTRDIAYAAALGADIAAPEATRRSLASRVRDGIIMQDTGTGGGWPVSTDRVVWALGAWAYYLSSGDQEWLHFSIDALKNTLAQDAAALRPTPLIPGETSFLDWREQSYPSWMTPADIGSSYAFGTNVLHYTVRRLLVRMLSEAGRKDEADSYAAEATGLGTAIERSFRDTAGQGYHMLTLPGNCTEMRTDALATALAVLSGLAGDHALQAMQALPRSPYGTPVFTPYKIEESGAYHNRSIWPFVEAFVLLAHAELQDTQGVEFSMASLLRAALAFGTNKENFCATTGRAQDTIQNSDRQLWSVAGMLGAFYHGLLGIQYEHDNLVFNPCIPESFAGSHWFTGLKIRDMVIDVHLNGYGTEICSALINGKAGFPIIPLDGKGHIQIELEIMPVDSEHERTPYPVAKEGLPTPQWDTDNCDSKRICWKRVPGAKQYYVYANGALMERTRSLSVALHISPRAMYREFFVRAHSTRSLSSLSAPLEWVAAGARHILQPVRIGEQAEYPIENNQAWLDTRPCTAHLVYESVTVPAGTYRVRILYCNATAPLRDGDTCALRELRVDDSTIGLVPFPHNTEQNQWEDYTLSAPLKMRLEAGEHTFSLLYTPACVNMNRELNQCMVRHIELTRLA